jgi:hypothetical protein
MKLYEHTEAIQLVEDWILEHDDEIRAAEGALPAELAELLAQAQMGFKEKAESVALMVRGFLASETALDAEIARLTARKKHFAKAAQGLKEYLRIQMSQAGEQKITTPRATMWRQLSGPSVKVADSIILEALAQDEGWSRFLLTTTVPEHKEYTVVKPNVIDHWKRLEIELAAIQTGDIDPLEPDWEGTPALPAGLTVERTEFLRIT